MLKQLKHRNIVKFYDAQRQNDGLYIFLEYVSQVSYSFTEMKYGNVGLKCIMRTFIHSF